MGGLATQQASTGNGRSNAIISRNPATGEVLGEVPEQGEAEVRAAVERAREAQRSWGEMPVRERARVVLRFRDEVVRHAEEMCQAISRETGKTAAEALAMEVVVIADLVTYFGKRAPKILAPEPIPLHLLKNRASYLHYTPRGVVGIIAPWNFPFSIPVGEAVMALLAGNGVVLKPSELTPLIALKAKELSDAAGIPSELFQVVTGRGPTGAALIDAGIDYCIFTGSTATGRKVAAACGERLIPCVLELGGKAPAIVCADADVDRTARALVWGAFANNGQVCVSVERVYAHESVYDELVDKVVEQTRALRQGDPARAQPLDLGAMTWDQQVEIVERRVRQAVDAGARLLAGGRRARIAAEPEGLFYEPTVLGDCRQDMEVMQKEIFGPVLPIMKVPDEREALRLANDSHLGLMGYVFTRDTQKGRRLAERVAAGTVMVNDVLLTFGAPETPWGGVKQSGIGRTHSDQGLRDLCELRHVNYDRLALRRELWWFPYSQTIHRQMLRALKWLFR
jgi:succinate-semialdehyde dehydrogenase/glutarate-semialdehyde dehydrogenase